MDLKRLELRISNECSSRCSFCYLQTYNNCSCGSTIEHIRRATKIVEENDFTELTISGGDIFDLSCYSTEIESVLSNLFDAILNKMNNGELNKLILETSLMHKAPFDFFNIRRVLDKADLSKVIVRTSYDTEGRFTEESLQAWTNEVVALSSEYGSLQKQCNIIMTQAFIDSIKSGFNLKELKDIGISEFKFLVPTCGYDSSDWDSDFCRKEDWNEELGLNFFPKRASFINILPVLNEQLGDEAILKMFAREDYPDNLIYWIEDTECWYPFNSDAAFNDFIGTADVDNGYIDSNEPMRNDVIRYCSDRMKCESGT